MDLCYRQIQSVEDYKEPGKQFRDEGEIIREEVIAWSCEWIQLLVILESVPMAANNFKL